MLFELLFRNMDYRKKAVFFIGFLAVTILSANTHLEPIPLDPEKYGLIQIRDESDCEDCNFIYNCETIGAWYCILS